MATIAEKSRTKEIIDRLQNVLNTASPVPLATGKVSLYKDEVQSLLDELALQMDSELKTYHEVNDRRGKIINEAKKQAEKIIYEAEHSASRMRVSRRSTNVVPFDYNTLSEEEMASLENANEIYAASLIYTDEMLTEVSELIENAYQNIRSEYEIVMQVMEEKLEVILKNKEELMSGLQEMDAIDRSQQILEIGQLLSNELYNERMKQRMESDEYDDGSVQLSLDLQVEQAQENARAAQEYAIQAAEALEQMTAERNALMETVLQMEKTQSSKEPKIDDENVKMRASQNVTSPIEESQSEEEVEYEIVYVTEDELEEGEEYEIEYVDEDDVVQTQMAIKKGKDVVGESNHQEEVQEEAEELEKMKIDETPVIPHFKNSDSDTVQSKKNEKTTSSGVIRRAVEKREKEQNILQVEQDDDIHANVTQKQNVKDEDIRVDAKGEKYVQATMQFAEDFEIMEF